MKNKIFKFFSEKHTYFILGSLFLLLIPNCVEVLSINYLPGLIYRSVILVLFGILSAMSFIFNKQYKIIYFTIFISIYLAFSIISLCLTKVKPNLKLETLDYLMSLGEIGSTVISLIFIYSCFKSYEINKQLIIKVLSYASIVLIILSIFIDWNSIVNTFTRFDHSNYDIKSIFFDKNTFGVFLFVGCICFCYLGITNKRQYLIGALVCTIYSAVARVKTSLVISLIILTATFVYCVISDLKSKKTKNLFIYILLIFIILIFGILTLFKVGLFTKIYDVVFGDYGLIYDGKVVIRERFKNWSNKVGSVNSPLIWIFGYGERLAYTFAGRPIDNAYIYIILNGGILKLILYFLIVFIIIKFKINQTYSPVTRSISLISLFSVLIYGFLEDFSLIGCSLHNLIFLLIVVCL